MKKILSIILCSRNDSYMGNSQWRLETTLNLTLLNAKDAGVLDQIEIIVSDWGSEQPLVNVLSLISEAEGRVQFLNIPSEIAQKEQKDSKFAVLALNAVARRATGDYIGRIDNDTVIGYEFFKNFFSITRNKSNLLFDQKTHFYSLRGDLFLTALAANPILLKMYSYSCYFWTET